MPREKKPNSNFKQKKKAISLSYLSFNQFMNHINGFYIQSTYTNNHPKKKGWFGIERYIEHQSTMSSKNILFTEEFHFKVKSRICKGSHHFLK